jgi:alpha-amylase/alpha-mannosidase (GH57 family)
LIEQIQAYIGGAKDTYQALSYKRADELSPDEKHFIKEHFFSANLNNIICVYPRYYQLYLKKQRDEDFTNHEYLDLQVWFNLAWFDYICKETVPSLKKLIAKGRCFNEEDKQAILKEQIGLLKEIIPAYKKFQENGQIEVTISPYYHPITPLLCDTNIAKEANKHVSLPRSKFNHPEDALTQIMQAVQFYTDTFGMPPRGIWPSEEAVSEHIIPFIARSGIKWLVSDEDILFRSLKKKRMARLLYRPYLLKREEGDVSAIFRDRNLSDLIGFVYHGLTEHAATADFIGHLHNIIKVMQGEDCLVVIAMDGENAWEYYRNDGRNFLTHLYKCISHDRRIQTVTVSEYLAKHPAQIPIRRISAGSWIYGNFNKWIGQEQKNKAWEYLAEARQELKNSPGRKVTRSPVDIEKAWRQIYVCEGSDWFWWYGDNNADFDELYRRHLRNFYTFIGKEPPDYLNGPI